MGQAKIIDQCDVVVVNFNAGPFLRDAVESALRSPAVAQILVIDNASTDESLQSLSPLQDERVAVIRNAANLGFAAACNMGLQQAKTDNILLLNPDCRAGDGAIDRLIQVLRSGGRIGMVGPHLLNPDGSEQAGGRRKLPTPALVLARMVAMTGLRRLGSFPVADFLLHQEPLPEGPIEVEAISGACMLVRREAIADVGPLDDNYFLHCEDLDWCMRFHQHGWSILFVPDAKAVHEKGVSSRSNPLSVEYHKHSGMVRFYRKLLGHTYSSWQMALVIAGIWTRFICIAAAHLLSSGAKRIWTAFRWGSWAQRAS